jgi:glycerophosphoryl diester phosphodiesterase
MITKNRIILASGALLCVMLLQHQLLAAGGPLRQHFANRRSVEVNPVQTVQTEISPLRMGGNSPAPVLIIAHRGASTFAPENTLESFRKAFELGCHMLELDVHFSRDGELFVVHDDELVRCSNVKKVFPNRKTYFVSDFTAAEIRTIDAGSWFIDELNKPAEKRGQFLQTLKDDEIQKYINREDRAHFGSGKVKVPALREVLEFAKSKKVLVNIEPKTLPRQYPGLTAAILKLVADLKMEREVIISSFDHDALVEVRQFSKVIATAALVSDRLHNPGKYIREFLDADAYNPGCYSDYDVFGFNSVNGKLTLESLQSARAAGLGVNVWTVDDPTQMRQLIDAGATGIITNYPHRLREVLAELEKAKK